MQYDFWIPDYLSPKELAHLKSLFLYRSFLSKLLIYFKYFQIFFYPNINLYISGGRHPIIMTIPYLNKSDIRSLHKKRIIFIDQICSIDENYLQLYPDTKKYFADTGKGRQLNWYTKLVQEKTWSQYNLWLIDLLLLSPIQRNRTYLPYLGIPFM